MRMKNTNDYFKQLRYGRLSPIYVDNVKRNVKNKLNHNSLLHVLSPLFRGTQEKRYKTIDLLIALGADVNAHDMNGQSPLDYVVSSKLNQYRLEMTKLLIKNGSDTSLITVGNNHKQISDLLNMVKQRSSKTCYEYIDQDIFKNAASCIVPEIKFLIIQYCGGNIEFVCSLLDQN
jgi:hypothetical protein